MKHLRKFLLKGLVAGFFGLVTSMTCLGALGKNNSFPQLESLVRLFFQMFEAFMKTLKAPDDCSFVYAFESLLVGYANHFNHRIDRMGRMLKKVQKLLYTNRNERF